jgi:hypothetical protein
MNNSTTPVGPTDILHQTDPDRVGHLEHHTELHTQVDAGHLFRSPDAPVLSVPVSLTSSVYDQVNPQTGTSQSGSVLAGSGTSEHPGNTPEPSPHGPGLASGDIQVSGRTVSPHTAPRATRHSAPNGNTDENYPGTHVAAGPAHYEYAPAATFQRAVHGIELTDQEFRLIERITHWDSSALAILANLIERARATSQGGDT